MKTIDWVRFVKWLKEEDIEIHDSIKFDLNGVAIIGNSDYYYPGKFFIVTNDMIEKTDNDLKQFYLIYVSSDLFRLNDAGAAAAQRGIAHLSCIPTKYIVDKILKIVDINNNLIWIRDGYQYRKYDIEKKEIINETSGFCGVVSLLGSWMKE